MGERGNENRGEEVIEIGGLDEAVIVVYTPNTDRSHIVELKFKRKYILLND